MAEKSPTSHSIPFAFYCGLFPRGAITDAARRKFTEQAKKEFPDRFNFKALNEMFDAFSTENAQIDVNGGLPSNFNAPAVRFTYDRLVYEAKCYQESFTRKQQLVRNQCIKLSNDGFLYSHPGSSLKVHKSADEVGPRHHSDTYCCLLDRSEQSKFPSLVAFSKVFLKTERPYFSLFDNFEESRIDFKAFNDQVSV